MLKLSDLAQRPDFQLGPLSISPSRRRVEGPAGTVHLEPLVMQVFLLLVDARGELVTRDQLFAEVWGGAMVGDDSLNRAVARVRRVASETAPGAFEIETIPRTGYRLTGELLSADQEIDPAKTAGGLSRRSMVLGGAVAAAGAGATWTLFKGRSDPRFDALIERGRQAIRLDEPNASKYFEQAAEIKPRSAQAWGLLAYALGSGRDFSPDDVAGPTAQASERAARTALAIDPNESNALLAMTYIQGHMQDSIAREDEYRRILTIDPQNTYVMRGLGQLMHGVGRCRESLTVVERALAIEPLTPDHQMRKAMRLWCLGRLTEADRVSDRAMQLWPSHRLVRLARLLIYTFTGRVQAALALVAEEEERPILLTPAVISIYRISLGALDDPTPNAVAAAREAILEGSKTTRAIASFAILALSALGELDAAFDVANGFLLSRGSIVIQPQSAAQGLGLNTFGWRNRFGLFTPPTKAMRLDSRFQGLAENLGLRDYWRRRGIGPDAFLFKR